MANTVTTPLKWSKKLSEEYIKLSNIMGQSRHAIMQEALEEYMAVRREQLDDFQRKLEEYKLSLQREMFTGGKIPTSQEYDIPDEVIVALDHDEDEEDSTIEYK